MWNAGADPTIHNDTLAFTHTFIHTKTDFCLLRIGRKPGFLDGIGPNKYVNEQWLMHSELI